VEPDRRVKDGGLKSAACKARQVHAEAMKRGQEVKLFTKPSLLSPVKSEPHRILFPPADDTHGPTQQFIFDPPRLAAQQPGENEPALRLETGLCNQLPHDLIVDVRYHKVAS
jgi:hypothetical protein